MSSFLLVAKIAGAVGTDGTLRAELFTDFPERLCNMQYLYVGFSGMYKKLALHSLVVRGGKVLLSFNGFTSPEQVGILIGREVFTGPEQAPVLPQNEFFVHDLIGADVVRAGIPVGILEDVLNLPAHDVYQIRCPDGSELLVPAVLTHIEKFDPAVKVLYLTPDGGIYDDED